MYSKHLSEATGLSLGFAAMLYGGDFDAVAEVVGAETVLADAEPEFGWIDVLKALYVAFAGGGEAGKGNAGQGMQDRRR